MNIPKLSKKEWYLIAGIAIVGVLAASQLIKQIKSDPNSPEAVKDAAEKSVHVDATRAVAASFGFLFLNKLAPMLLARIGLTGFAALGGWPLILSTAGVFAAFGGYDIVRSAVPFLPALGSCPPGYTKHPQSGYCVKVEVNQTTATDMPTPHNAAIVAPSDNLDDAWQQGAFQA